MEVGGGDEETACKRTQPLTLFTEAIPEEKSKFAEKGKLSILTWNPNLFPCLSKFFTSKCSVIKYL